MDVNPSGFESQYHHQFMTPSITTTPVFKPTTNRQVSMEDVSRMALSLMKSIHDLGIQMPSKDEDQFFADLCLFLEERFNWPDYTNYN